MEDCTSDMFSTGHWCDPQVTHSGKLVRGVEALLGRRYNQKVVEYGINDKTANKQTM